MSLTRSFKDFIKSRIEADPEFRQALEDNGVVLVRWKDLQRAAGRP